MKVSRKKLDVLQCRSGMTGAEVAAKAGLKLEMQRVKASWLFRRGYCWIYERKAFTGQRMVKHTRLDGGLLKRI